MKGCGGACCVSVCERGWGREASDAFEHVLDEGVDAAFVVGVGVVGSAVGNDHAARHGLVPHEARQPRQCTAFHFEVGDAHAAVGEALNFLVGVRVGQGQTQLSALRTEEAAAGHRYAVHHVGAGNACYEFGVGIHHVGVRYALVAAPLHVLHEGLLKGEVAHGVAASVEVEQPVEADALDAGHPSAHGRVGLQTATGAYAHQFQLAQRGAHGAGVEVDVGQGVEFVHHDVNVVAAYARRHHGDAFALVGACDGAKLAALHCAFAFAEVRGHKVYAAGVAHKNHLVGQLLGQHVQVKDAAVGVDDEFGGRNSIHGKRERGLEGRTPRQPLLIYIERNARRRGVVGLLLQFRFAVILLQGVELVA